MCYYIDKEIDKENQTMKLIKSIYKAPVVVKEYCEEQGITFVIINYNGKNFYGTAILSKQDEGFYSKKVGYNIALSKARIQALKYSYEKEKNKLNTRKQFYQEVLGFGAKTSAEVDPSNAFHHNIARIESRLSAIKSALDKEEDMLNKYIVGQDKAIESVKRFRRKANDN